MSYQFLISISLVATTYAYYEQMPYTLFKWSTLEFGFPSDEIRNEAEVSGNLIPTNAIPIDVQPSYDERHHIRTFITIPKFMNGIPYSLATVSYENGKGGPLLQPYPNYEIHQNRNGTNCDTITSAFRMVINECNQMWVIDSGVLNSINQCPPQLWLINLETDQIIHRYRFDEPLYQKDISLFIAIAVNVRDPWPRGYCRDTMVYVADVNFHGLLVYDYRQNRAWRIENMFMYPDPDYGLQTVADKSFVLMDGIFALTTDSVNLYFHPMASRAEYSVPLQVIDNGTLFENDVTHMYEPFTKLGERKSPCTSSAIDSSNNVYCVTLQPIELIKWNVNKPYSSRYIKKLPIIPEQLEFVSGLKVFENIFGFEELWMISNKFQDMATDTQDFNNINFRILRRFL